MLKTMKMKYHFNVQDQGMLFNIKLPTYNDSPLLNVEFSTHKDGPLLAPTNFNEYF